MNMSDVKAVELAGNSVKSISMNSTVLWQVDSKKIIVLTPSPSTTVSYVTLNLPSLISQFNSTFSLNLSINDYYNYQTSGQGSFVFQINRVKVYNANSWSNRTGRFALSINSDGSQGNNYMQSSNVTIVKQTEYELTTNDMITNSNTLILYSYNGGGIYTLNDEYLYLTNGTNLQTLQYREVEIELVYL